MNNNDKESKADETLQVTELKKEAGENKIADGGIDSRVSDKYDAEKPKGSAGPEEKDIID